MLESKRLPRIFQTIHEQKQGEQGGNKTVQVGLANHWGGWVEVYSYIRPQRVYVDLQTLPNDASILVQGEFRFVENNGRSKVQRVLGDTQFFLELGRDKGAPRERVFARFFSSWVPTYRGANNAVRERVIISKVQNLR